jgi:hypothetical protein
MTQIFLPYNDFSKIAKCLDNKRLNKALTEAKQVYTANRYGFGKQGNPAPYEMWRGYDEALALYIIECYKEWQHRLTHGERGGVLLHKAGEYILSEVIAGKVSLDNIVYPDWISDKRIFSSYRAALLDKDYSWYSQFGWVEQPDIPEIDKKGNKHYHYVYGKGK